MERGLAPTREWAQCLILSGAVSVGGLPATRPAQPVETEADITLREQGETYVSRGAHKLLAALERWDLAVSDAVAVDIGASTGGFTDVLLKAGARKVYAVDVGYGQLHTRLRNDPRVVVMERTNARLLSELPEPIDLAVIDVSFISLRLVLPPVFALLRPEAPIVTLVKPQFEAGRGKVGKGGVVRRPEVHREVLASIMEWSAAQPWRIVDLAVSPIRGPAGNVEFLALWQRDGELAPPQAVERVLSEATHILPAR